MSEKSLMQALSENGGLYADLERRTAELEAELAASQQRVAELEAALDAIASHDAIHAYGYAIQRGLVDPLHDVDVNHEMLYNRIARHALADTPAKVTDE